MNSRFISIMEFWNKMITHLCHDLEIDIKGLPFFRKGLPFFLTMTKGEIASLHNSRRKQKFHFSKEKKLLSWTSPRIASLKSQENVKMCYRAYLKKSKYANLHIFKFASLYVVKLAYFTKQVLLSWTSQNCYLAFSKIL